MPETKPTKEKNIPTQVLANPAKTPTPSVGRTGRGLIRYKFSASEFSDFYHNIKEFKKAVDCGRYIFFDGYLVLRNPECFTYVNGTYVLNSCVIDNPRKYCFSIRRHRPFLARMRRPTNGRAYRARPTIKTTYDNAEEFENTKEITITKLVSYINNGIGPTDNFTTVLKKIMLREGITEENLAELTGFSVKTIQRLRNAEIKPSLPSVIAVCIAMSLSSLESNYLVELAGYKLTWRKQERVYSYLLNIGDQLTVQQCNDILREIKMKPLSNL